MDELEREAVEIGQELGKLRRLVARLAATGPWAYDVCFGQSHAECFFCEVDKRSERDHDPGCLWLQAKKAVGVVNDLSPAWGEVGSTEVMMTWTYTAWDVPQALAEMFENEFSKLRPGRPPLSPVQLTGKDSGIVLAVLRRVLDEDVGLLGALNSIIADLGKGRTLEFAWQEDRRG